MLRIAVVGCGRIGTRHAQTAAEHPLAASVVLVDVAPGRARDVARQLGVEAAEPDRTALDVGADVAVVAAPTAAHVALVRDLVVAGIPTLCEKPLALSLDETRELGEYVDRHDAFVQVGFQRRFDSGLLALRAQLREGQLGRVYLLRLTAHDGEAPPAAYLATSGGMFRDLHIHDFDAIRWLTGAEARTVTAVTARLGAAPVADDDADTSAIVLGLSDESIAVVTGTRHDPLGYDVRVEAFGSRSVAAAGLTSATPLVAVGPDATAFPAAPYTSFLDRFGDAYARELNAFLRAASAREPSPVSWHASYEALRIAAAAELAVREARTVFVDDVS